MGRETRRPPKTSEVQTLSETAILVKRIISASAPDCLEQLLVIFNTSGSRSI